MKKSEKTKEDKKEEKDLDPEKERKLEIVDLDQPQKSIEIADPEPKTYIQLNDEQNEETIEVVDLGVIDEPQNAEPSPQQKEIELNAATTKPIIKTPNSPKNDAIKNVSFSDPMPKPQLLQHESHDLINP